MSRFSYKLLILLIFSLPLYSACDETGAQNQSKPRKTGLPKENEKVPPKLSDFTACQSSDECQNGEICSNLKCVSLDQSKVDLCLLDSFKKSCEDRNLKCEKNRCLPNCDQTCGGVCCGASESCFNEQCTAVTCNAGQEMCATKTGITCCGASQGCVANTCVDLGDSCDNVTSFCPIWKFCEIPGHKNCVEYDQFADDDLCTIKIPDKLEMEEVLVWGRKDPSSHTSYRQVMSSPVVGFIDDDSYPDIIFNSFQGDIVGKGILRVISGRPDTLRKTNTREIFNSVDIPDSFYSAGEASPAIGDINGDGVIDIVTPLAFGKGVIAIDKNKNLVWKKTTLPDNSELTVPTASAVALANLDHAGAVEVLVGKYVLDGGTGAVLCTLGEDSLTPLAVDLDEKGNMEIIHGGRIYSFTRNAGGSATCSDVGVDTTHQSSYAFSAVANVIKRDPTPEIVTIHNGTLRILTSTGREVCNVVLDTSGGGPPTISNFDAVGDLEIAVATPNKYSLVDSNCSEKWHFSPTKDVSSGITGSSLFDFNGDGKAEILYNDEEKIRILSDNSGHLQERIDPISNSNYTKIEFPVVVDLTGDGHANIIATANSSHRHGDSSAQKGLIVFSDPKNRWLGTRQLWNQHTYHGTNINDDGSIPLHENHHWKQEWSNNFRQNVQKGNLRFAPNLKPKLDAIYNSACSDSSAERDISFTLTNLGKALVPANAAKIAIYASIAGADSYDLVTELDNPAELTPGKSEFMRYTWKNIPPKLQGKKLDIKIKVNPDSTLAECKYDDNEDVITNVSTVAPDLFVNVVDSGTGACSTNNGFNFKYEVRNLGDGVAVAGSFDIGFYTTIEGQRVKLASAQTTRDLNKGDFETLTTKIDFSDKIAFNQFYEIEVVVDDPKSPTDRFGKLLECNESNNVVKKDVICYIFL